MEDPNIATSSEGDPLGINVSPKKRNSIDFAMIFQWSIRRFVWPVWILGWVYDFEALTPNRPRPEVGQEGAVIGINGSGTMG